MTGTDDLRIGDAERQTALSTLRQAAEEARLTPQELDERAARARTAWTSGELAAVLADLRPGPLLPRPYGVPTAAMSIAIAVPYVLLRYV